MAKEKSLNELIEELKKAMNEYYNRNKSEGE